MYLMQRGHLYLPSSEEQLIHVRSTLAGTMGAMLADLEAAVDMQLGAMSEVGGGRIALCAVLEQVVNSSDGNVVLMV